MEAFGMVGRGDTLRDLEDVWKATLDGNGRCILLEGRAGMGKTTVLRHFLASMSSQESFCLQGTGYLLHKDLLYAPFIEALDDFFHAQDVSKVREWCAGLEELGGWFPRLRLPSSSFSRDVALDSLRLFRCFVEFFSRIADERPVFFVIEDLHWADEATLKLFHFLVCNLSHKKVLLFATLRSEDVETEVGLQKCISSLKKMPVVTHLCLKPLSPSASKTLIHSRLGADVSLRLLRMLLEQTGGYPFFLCGLLDAIQQSRSLFFDGRQWRFNASELPLPRSVQELVKERLSQLSAEDVELLALLAVGRRGLHRRMLLELMKEQAPNKVDEGLTRLIHQGILEEVIWQGEEAYCWTHPLFQQGVYDALPLRIKSQKHDAFVDVLEKQKDTPCLLLAHHYRMMGRLAHHERALSVLCEAAKLTRREESLKEAESYLRAALEIAEALSAIEHLASIKRSLGEVLFLQGHLSSAIEHYLEVLSLCEDARDPVCKAQTHHLLAHALWGQMAFEEALGHLQAGLDVLPAHEEPEIRERLQIDQLVFLDRSSLFGQLRTLLERYQDSHLQASPHFQVTLGVIEVGADLREGRYADAQQRIHGLLPIAIQTQDDIQWIRVRNFAGLVAVSLGDCEEAMAQMRKSLGLIRERGLLWCEPSVLGMGGIACVVAGHLEEAQRLAEQALSICRKIRLDRYLLRMLALRSITFSMRGEWEASLASIEEAKALPAALSQDVHMAASLWLAEAIYAVETARYDDALSSLRRLRKGEEVVALDSTLPTLLLSQWGLAYAGRGDLAALEIVIQMFEVRRASSAYCHAWEVYFLGRKALLSARPKEALAFLEEASKRFEQLGFVFDAAKTALLWLQTSSTLVQPLSPSVQNVFLAKCRETFHLLGASHALSALDQVRGLLLRVGLSSQEKLHKELSKREKEVIVLLSQGLSNKEIAQQLVISHHTVATYLKRLYQRFEVHSRIALLARLQERDREEEG